MPVHDAWYGWLAGKPAAVVVWVGEVEGVSGWCVCECKVVQVEDDGSCVVFMEPGRSRHACLEDLVLCSTTLLEFYPGIPKVEALQQLRKYKNDD